MLPRVKSESPRSTTESIIVRRADRADLAAIRRIFNEGIEDRATLDADLKTVEDVADWWKQHDERYAVIVCADNDDVVGWASLNRFSHRCAHAAIADLSVYLARSHRGHGFGFSLLSALDAIARARKFHKIVLHALDGNARGKRLYLKSGFVEVGVFKEHGLVDGRFVDVVAMEKLLS